MPTYRLELYVEAPDDGRAFIALDRAAHAILPELTSWHVAVLDADGTPTDVNAGTPADLHPPIPRS